MFNYIEDEEFVKDVLEQNFIMCLIRGSVICDSLFNFDILGLQAIPFTQTLKVIAEISDNDKENKEFKTQEVNKEKVFPVKIVLPENSIEGIKQAIDKLEIWADFMALAMQHARIIIDNVGAPTAVVTISRKNLERHHVDEWNSLFSAYLELKDEKKREAIKKALWWYRKGCNSLSYSLFDSYTAYWNALEILCSVEADKTNEEDTTLAIRKSLEGKIKIDINGKIKEWKITPNVIHQCFYEHVGQSIARQMKLSLKAILGDEKAKQWVDHCFTLVPKHDQLYQIRNDINHGNIPENSTGEYRRIHRRYTLLSLMVLYLLKLLLGGKTPFMDDLNALQEYIDKNVLPPVRTDLY